MKRKGVRDKVRTKNQSNKSAAGIDSNNNTTLMHLIKLINSHI